MLWIHPEIWLSDNKVASVLESPPATPWEILEPDAVGNSMEVPGSYKPCTGQEKINFTPEAEDQSAEQETVDQSSVGQAEAEDQAQGSSAKVKDNCPFFTALSKVKTFCKKVQKRSKRCFSCLDASPVSQHLTSLDIDCCFGRIVILRLNF